MILLNRKGRNAFRDREIPTTRVLSQAIGALAVGAVAIGALAIGALAVGRLAIRRARIQKLEIDELVVGRLRVTEKLQAPSMNDVQKSERPSHASWIEQPPPKW
jgi:hypothetical protein